MKVMDDMLKLVKTIKFIPSTSARNPQQRPPFLSGIECGINSIKDLLTQFQSEGFEYILTHRLSQDHLGMLKWNFFDSLS